MAIAYTDSVLTIRFEHWLRALFQSNTSLSWKLDTGPSIHDPYCVSPTLLVSTLYSNFIVPLPRNTTLTTITFDILRDSLYTNYPELLL